MLVAGPLTLKSHGRRAKRKDRDAISGWERRQSSFTGAKLGPVGNEITCCRSAF
jgi:hypothetical protein